MRNPKPMELRRERSAATTYELAGESWAICTVNNITGELLITSDWGNWSYQWSTNPKHLGSPTLTHFIAERNGQHYLADKLQGRGGGKRFSMEDTVAALRKQLCAVRLEHGREQIERAECGGGIPELSFRKVERYGHSVRPTEYMPYLSKDHARVLWDEIESCGSDISDGSDAASTLYLERLSKIDDVHTYVTEEPWNYIETRQAFEDRVLRESIIPALMDACRRTVQRAAIVAANGPQEIEA